MQTNEQIREKIQSWYDEYLDRKTKIKNLLPDSRKFPESLEILAMTTNGTSGIFKVDGRKLYYYIQDGKVQLDRV